MAEVDRTVNGKPIADAIAGDDSLQRVLSNYAFEIKAFADVSLIDAIDHSLAIGRHVDFDSFIAVEKAPGVGQDAGWDVTLDDTLGQGAANNIEQGRLVEFFDKTTGLPMGGMVGLFLLTNAVQAVADRHRSELRGG